MDPTIKLPAVGSFPGYKLGRSLFLTWATMLNEHADIWNTTWATLLSGDYRSADYFSAVALSLKSSSSALEQSFRSMERRGSPPWSPVLFDATQVADVKVGQTIDQYDALTCTVLHAPEANAATSLVVSVAYAGPYSVALSFDDSVQPAPGDYLGVVTCQRYREPLAIIVVSVRADAAKGAVPASLSAAKSGSGRAKVTKEAAKKVTKRTAANRKSSAKAATSKKARRRAA